MCLRDHPLCLSGQGGVRACERLVEDPAVLSLAEQHTEGDCDPRRFTSKTGNAALAGQLRQRPHLAGPERRKPTPPTGPSIHTRERLSGESSEREAGSRMSTLRTSV